jgi:hypothetical protein
MIYAPIVVKKESDDRVCIKRSVELEACSFFSIIIPGREINIEKATETNRIFWGEWIYSNFVLLGGFKGFPQEFPCYLAGEWAPKVSDIKENKKVLKEKHCESDE